MSRCPRDRGAGVIPGRRISVVATGIGCREEGNPSHTALARQGGERGDEASANRGTILRPHSLLSVLAGALRLGEGGGHRWKSGSYRSYLPFSAGGLDLFLRQSSVAHRENLIDGAAFHDGRRDFVR